MTEHLIARTPSAYGYPLLIKQLFEAPLVDNPAQEIVYGGALLLRVKAVEAIDKTSVGKTNKVALRQKHR